MTKTQTPEPLTIDQLTEADRAICPICKNRSMILCPPTVHLAEVDENGWCVNCDSPDVPDKVMCPCQD